MLTTLQPSYNQRLFAPSLRSRLHVARFYWLHNFLARNGIAHDSVFELGCYDAKTLQYLPHLPREYVGCDANWESGLDLARSKWAGHNFEFHECQRAEDIRIIENRKFDLVVCMETFEHVPLSCLDDYFDLINKISDGWIIVTVPNEKGILFLAKYLMKRLVPRLRGKETESYTISDVIWSTLGVTSRVPRGEHKGFDYDTLIDRLSEHFDIQEVVALPFSWLPRSLGFTIGIAGCKKSPSAARPSTVHAGSARG